VTAGPADLRIAFLGDSYVNGTGDPACLGWTGRVCAALWQQGHRVTCYNLGVRRDTGVEVHARLQTEVLPRLPASTPRGPVERRLAVSFGVGDTMPDRVGAWGDEAARNLHCLLTEAAALDQPLPVFVVGPPPVADPDHTSRVRILSKAFADICEELGVPYLPVVDALLAAPAWLGEVRGGDGFHPSAKGYAELARLVLRSDAWHRWVTPAARLTWSEPDQSQGRGGKGGVRFTIELCHTTHGVEGELLREEGLTTTPERFTGWLELLRLLEDVGDEPSEPG
jgi:lysophospholipase L1-like esterase